MIGRISSYPVELEFEGDLCRHPEGDEIENIRLRQCRLYGHEIDISVLPEIVQKNILAQMEEIDEWTHD